jgi:3-deoxy-manno-octulosonate cytidylyltransferase (CMP-KDO synthetase)|tara:strand:- start:18382 stop:19122 length:741 start_codon:yes stop_codon:yes gene_type:complete
MIIGLIPSRLNSKRLKEKPLLNIDGLPIIVHSLKRAQLSKKLDKIFVCTDHKKIVDVVKKNNGQAIMTSKKHRNGTERIYEVAKKIKKAKFLIDIQGDQPLISPEAIDATVDFHKKNKQFDIVLPSMPINGDADNKSLVKTIFSEDGRIIYFSREKTPYNYSSKKIKYYKNLSIISFTPQALKKFYKAKMGKLEKTEGIELMRALEIGLSIGTFVIKGSDFAVDVNADLLKAINLMPKDKYRKFYK